MSWKSCIIIRIKKIHNKDALKKFQEIEGIYLKTFLAFCHVKLSIASLERALVADVQLRLQAICGLL